MLFSLALIFVLGMLLGGLFRKLNLPSLLGMLITGIVLGPCVLNLLSDSILSVSADLRQIALIIILTRAGFNLNIEDLKKVGRPAFLMCFLPACFEIAGTVIAAPLLLGINRIEAAVLGTVIAAVSPAVVVPKMLKLKEEGFGTNKGIPQLIMAGASVDDVFVIVLFSSFTDVAKNGSFHPEQLIRIPTSIITGLAGGIICGIILAEIFTKFHIRDSIKVVVILSVSFLLVTLDSQLTGVVGFSGLLGVMSMSGAIGKMKSDAAKRIADKYSKLWVAAEVLLFVLVGAAVKIEYVFKSGGKIVLMIFAALVFRMAGVLFCLIKTKLNKKERLFCMLAYTPKATVQAAIGSIPLTMGLSCGNVVLTTAVCAILITAPLGAFMIDCTYKRFLSDKP